MSLHRTLSQIRVRSTAVPRQLARIMYLTNNRQSQLYFRVWISIFIASWLDRGIGPRLLTRSFYAVFIRIPRQVHILHIFGGARVVCYTTFATTFSVALTLYVHVDFSSHCNWRLAKVIRKVEVPTR